jgi:signal peptidase I
MRITHLLVVIIVGAISSCKGKVYRAGSTSMSETIQQGEPFYVKKTSSFKRNDIVVFEYYGNDYSKIPIDGIQFEQHWERRIFRLIALSGDTIDIKQGEVVVNGKPVPPPAGARFPYFVYAKMAIDDLLPQEDDFSTSLISATDTFLYKANLTKDAAAELELRKPAVIKLERIRSEENTFSDTAFARASATDKWNPYNYGPLYIPTPGETITVNADNFKLYHNIPGIKMGENKITEQLYFVMGDNRHAAEDSRYIGFISHSNMYGVVK